MVVLVVTMVLALIVPTALIALISVMVAAHWQ